MLVLDNVCVAAGRQPIIDRLSLQLNAAEMVGLIGPNGAGKSTLLHAIANLRAFSGRITWQKRPIRIAEIGFMPQQCHVKAQLSVLDTLLLGCHEKLGLRVQSELVERAINMLESFHISHLHRRPMNRLSGGQQQLVLLAQRLLRQPQLLLLDEATSALDIRHQMMVCERLQSYVQSSGALVIMAVHDLSLAAQFMQRVALLSQGRLAASGAFAEVLTEQSLRQVYGIEAEILRSSSGRIAVVPIAPVQRLCAEGA